MQFFFRSELQSKFKEKFILKRQSKGEIPFPEMSVMMTLTVLKYQSLIF